MVDSGGLACLDPRLVCCEVAGVWRSRADTTELELTFLAHRQLRMQSASDDRPCRDPKWINSLFSQLHSPVLSSAFFSIVGRYRRQWSNSVGFKSCRDDPVFGGEDH